MKKVVIGMSGGVDSSVAALLLKKQGYDVIGLFMRNWDSTLNNDYLGNPTVNDEICPQEQDYNDASEVCKKLDIPLYRVDFIKEYWDHVFNYFLEELKLGRTPNPDIMCNKYIKFDAFYKEALKLGADYIATGHYAKIKDNHLYKAYDKNKDQSYFLSQIPNSILPKVLFPLGDIDKQEVRKIAEESELFTAKKKDSTGICFIGERNFKQFLKNYLPNNPGDIINIENNEKLGTHIGLMYYTLGQRRGLEVGGFEDKLFVVKKDVINNILFVAPSEENDYLISDMAIISDLNWFIDEDINDCTAKFRYRQADQNVSIQKVNNEVIVKYPSGIKAITPGQACVFYKDDLCLGGGIIKEVYKKGIKIA